jgi:hypothetical protein
MGRPFTGRFFIAAKQLPRIKTRQAEATARYYRDLVEERGEVDAIVAKSLAHRAQWHAAARIWRRLKTLKTAKANRVPTTSFEIYSML